MITLSIVSVIARSDGCPAEFEDTIHFCSLVAMSKGKRNGSLRRTATMPERFPTSPVPPRQRKAESVPPLFSSVYLVCLCMASRSWRQISLNSLNGSSVPSMPFARISSGDRLGSA